MQEPQEFLDVTVRVIGNCPIHYYEIASFDDFIENLNDKKNELKRKAADDYGVKIHNDDIKIEFVYQDINNDINFELYSKIRVINKNYIEEYSQYEKYIIEENARKRDALKREQKSVEAKTAKKEYKEKQRAERILKQQNKKADDLKIIISNILEANLSEDTKVEAIKSLVRK